MTDRFEEVVATRERLRQIVSQPTQAITDKVIDHIDNICSRFIAASPFVVLATKGADGLIDVSPKGDPAGFVIVLDEKTLAIPDRPGNKRVDSFENILVNPEIGMIFLISGYGYTLRVSGTASIVRDRALQSQLSVDGKPPDLVLIVRVQQAFMHCAKCIARSKLWQPTGWPTTENVPSLAEAMVAHANSPEVFQTSKELSIPIFGRKCIDIDTIFFGPRTTIAGWAYPLWVKSGHVRRKKPCPLCP